MQTVEQGATGGLLPVLLRKKLAKTLVDKPPVALKSRARLDPAIALLSVLAVTLLSLWDASLGRRPTREVIPVTYVTVLSAWRFGQSRDDLSVHDIFYAQVRLGGHQNQRRDYPPGWLVLWRG